MTTRELASALDFPEDRTDCMTEENLHLLTNTEIPGKIVYSAIHCLSSYFDLRIASDTPSSKKRDSIDSDFDAFEMDFKRMKIDDSEDVDAGDDHGDCDGLSEVEAATLTEEESVAIHLPDPDEECEAEPTAKATKSDDAEVPVKLWNDRVVEKLEEHWRDDDRRTMIKLNLTPKSEDRVRFDKFSDNLRNLAVRFWRKKVRKDFGIWYELHGKPDDDKEIWKAGMKAVKRAWWCTFWDWPRGSSIFFWRWPPDYQRVARLGLAPMFDGDPPTSMDYQPPYDDLEVKAKVKAKLQRVLDRGYVEMCDIQLVESLMYMFMSQRERTYTNGVQWHL